MYEAFSKFPYLISEYTTKFGLTKTVGSEAKH